MKRKVISFLIILICFLLQSTVFPKITFFSVKPNLLIIVTASFGFMRGKKEGMFVGFICGLISQDHDLEQVYLDGFLTIAKLEGKDVTNTLEQLKDIGSKYGITFVISMSLDKEEIPETVQAQIITAL